MTGVAAKRCRLAALGFVFVATACAPKNYVVLLDNPDGGSGKVIVSTNAGRQVLDRSGTATSISSVSREPSQPWRLKLEKIREVFERALGARPRRFHTYTLMFQSGRTDLDAGSEAEFHAMVQDVAVRPGADVTIAGYADRQDNESRNELIALLRAYRVRDAVVAAGVPIERIELDSYGESRPAVETADNVSELRNRRVEVTVR